MKYFENFERIDYNNQIVVNIFDAILMKYREVENNALYFKYSVKPGEKPEHIAYDIYGDADLHWILILTNRIVDPNFDWYLSQSEVESLAKSKYDDINAIHHYEFNPVSDTSVYYEDYVNDDSGVVELSSLPSGSAIRFRPGDWIDSWFVEQEGDVGATYISPVTNLKYEFDLNEARREINVISEVHIGNILTNFDAMLSDPDLFLTTV